MHVLAFKPAHDGQIAYVRDGRLEFSIEAEKDNSPRYSATTPWCLIRAFSRVGRCPDVVALSGWSEEYKTVGLDIGSGYYGHDESNIATSDYNFLGSPAKYFTSSHERSHIMCSYGMSPFRQGQPCYALVWESIFGTFYYVDEHVRFHKIGDVLSHPGIRYGFLYALADPAYRNRFRFEDAGKLMAVAGYGASGSPTAEEQAAVSLLLEREIVLETEPGAKEALRTSAYYNIGVRSPEFRALARKFSDALFSVFAAFASSKLERNLPLIISGGCGLNCDWNTEWKKLGVFSDVFVPPCCNDAGAAIGTAIDAQHHFTGNAKIDWSAYAGEEFVADTPDSRDFEAEALSIDAVAASLAGGDILGWVQGRYEIGPRALGNRSILAAPFSAETKDALNRIKEREDFRPIAPVCLEEDFDKYFDGPSPSPHMLYFHRVRDDRLKAITHVDGSARVQTVSRQQNAPLYDLLQAFKRRTGVGVLCNTSLNFKGAGFINRSSDLQRYARTAGLDGYVVADSFFRRSGARLRQGAVQSA